MACIAGSRQIHGLDVFALCQVRVNTAHFTGTNGSPDSTTSYFTSTSSVRRMGGQFEVKDGATKKYYSIAGMMVAVNDGTGLQYLLTDHLGSTVAVTNQSGTLTSQQRYLPFGAARTIPNSPILGTDFTYTGQRKLDDGMGGIMDYKARFYSPALGRFQQPDGIIPNPLNPQAFNRFSYVGNRPINYNDPSGHNAECGLGELGCNAGRYTPPPDQRGSLDRVLASYGITTTGFTRQEKWAILRGARLVGDKLAEVRGEGESAVDAFNAVYEDGINFNQGATNATGLCASGTITSGGCTSSENQINFWTMTGHNMYGDAASDAYDFSRMIKNVVHELGHSFYHYRGNPLLGNSFSRNTLIRNQRYPDGEYVDWEQHPPSMNADGNDIPTELFADTFIAWTYTAWNPLTANEDAVTTAQNAMSGYVPKP